jgi:hypothetical protein
MRFSDIRFRPIDVWPGELTPPHRRKRAAFDTPWGRTIQLLERELSMLEAQRTVFQVALLERDFRNDGRPRAQARAEHPGVIVAFDSKWGPLKYATDTFTTWQDNVRAVALSMEALRKVDRYGVSKRGEQYRGWRALTTGSDPAEGMTRETAAAYLRDVWENDIRRALFETHPDTGGDPGEFRKVQRARELLA